MIVSNIYKPYNVCIIPIIYIVYNLYIYSLFLRVDICNKPNAQYFNKFHQSPDVFQPVTRDVVVCIEDSNKMWSARKPSHSPLRN